jgi:uncharacterized protein (DUF1800 family)
MIMKTNLANQLHLIANNLNPVSQQFKHAESAPMSQGDLASSPAVKESMNPSWQSMLAASAGSAALVACGGGGDNDNSVSTSSMQVSMSLSAQQASRFVQMTTFGTTAEDVAALTGKTAASWFDAQTALPLSKSHRLWLTENGWDSPDHRHANGAIDYSMWNKFITSPDQLRQRMVYALSQILVVGVGGVGTYYKQQAFAYYLDLLEANAFGNFRTLLEKITLCPVMGLYLSYLGNSKADANGRLPDENYAREIMQLFTIGLYELNNDGSLKLQNGQPIETYDQSDVTNLARVFTGWRFNPDASVTDQQTRDREAHVVPMRLDAGTHSPEAKVFLNANIPANTNGTESLRIALDALFNHPNVGPFIGKQLIQRFVTSNPSPSYINRVANAFNNTSGVRGDLKATLRAVLLDAEALAPANTASGKLMEPVLRFTQWARAFKVTSPKIGNDVSPLWAGNSSEPSTRLGQSPLRSASVFNFFRPGYVPPAASIANRGWVAPELQITSEVSIAGYMNYMQELVSGVHTRLVPNYDTWLAKVDNLDALIAELNLVIAAQRLSASTISKIKTACASIPTTTDQLKKNRLYTAIFLMLTAPEFILTV